MVSVSRSVGAISKAVLYALIVGVLAVGIGMVALAVYSGRASAPTATPARADVGAKVELGMTEEQVKAAVGEPDLVAHRVGPGHFHYLYGDTELVFEDGKVFRVTRGRELIKGELGRSHDPGHGPGG